MKFYTLQMEDSIQFYMCFSSYISFDKYIKHLSELKCIFNLSGNDQVFYENHVLDKISTNFLFRDEVYKTVFDENGDIKPLDETIYQKLLAYTKKVLSIFNDLHEKTMVATNEILSGDYPGLLKELALLSMHDVEISCLKFEKSYLNLTLKINDNYTTYSFHVVTDQEYGELNDGYKSIVYEELFACPNNLFEYNILIRNWNNSALNEEISILFDHVELRSKSCRCG